MKVCVSEGDATEVTKNIAATLHDLVKDMTIDRS